MVSITEPFDDQDLSFIAGGTIRIAGGGDMAIFAASGKASDPAPFVEVDNLRVPYRAVDDDMPDGWNIPEPDTSGLAPAFRKGFVLPLRDIGGEQTNLAFIPHMETRDVPILISVRDGWQFDNVANENNSLFWTIYIRGAFQDTAAKDDDDPNFPASGVTWGIADVPGDPSVKRGQGVNIYMEVLHPHELVKHAGVNEIDTVVHEVGHLFHGSHSDGGIMTGGGQIPSPDFSKITLDRIRKIDYP